MSSKQPASKIDLYWPITAAIWRNESGGDGKAWYSVTFDRAYKDKDGALKSADSFSGDELLVLAKVANLAHSEIHHLRASDRAAGIERQPGAEG